MYYLYRGDLAEVTAIETLTGDLANSVDRTWNSGPIYNNKIPTKSALSEDWNFVYEAAFRNYPRHRVLREAFRQAINKLRDGDALHLGDMLADAGISLPR